MLQSTTPTRARAAIACALASLTLAACDGSLVPRGRADAGSFSVEDAHAPFDAASPERALVLTRATDECRDIGVPHSDEPLFALEIEGPPDDAVDLWASRPECGVEPFLFATVELDHEGHGVLARNHPGNDVCDDPLIGGWTVIADDGAMQSAPVVLSFVNSNCSDGPSCLEAGTSCPPAPPETDAGAANGGAADAGVADPGVADAGLPDVGSPDAGASDGCTIVADEPGLVHTSTDATLRRVEAFPETASTSWTRFEVSLDVYVASWTDKQGQYEVFSMLRGRRWTGYAIGYVALVGPGRLGAVTTANLGLDGAAAPPGGDGRRASGSYPFQTMHTYHFDYVYDTVVGRRRLEIFDGTTRVMALEGPTFVTSIDIEPEGARLVLGGQEIDGAPDASTLGWQFSNVRVRACR